jgi:hypothetical protein
MSTSLLTPDLRRILGDLGRRVGILERRVSTAAASVDSSQEIIFSYAGSLAASTSPPVRIWRGGNLSVVAVTFAPGGAGSTDTIIDVLRNGTAIGIVTVPGSTEIYNAEITARFVADVDTLALQVTTAGTGAADMTATARFT